MSFFRDTFELAAIELRFLVRYPRLLLACVFVTLIPGFYACLYLSSVWDPAAHTRELTVGVVNLDRGMRYQGHEFNIGRQLVKGLAMTPRFGFRVYSAADEARADVRAGTLAFALIIPPEFSANAVPGTVPNAGKPLLYVSEGNSFQGADLARRFAEALDDQLNEHLNAQRWSIALDMALGAGRSVESLRQGVQSLNAGAHQMKLGAREAAGGAAALKEGSSRLTEKLPALTEGMQRLGDGLRTLDAHRPHGRDLRTLSNGAEALAAGQQQFGQGLEAMRNGHRELSAGLQTFSESTFSSLLLPESVAQGARQLGEGLGRLDAGLIQLMDAHSHLAAGANELNTGVQTLTTGVHAMSEGIHQASAQFPPDEKLDELSHGASSLASGAAALAQGNRALSVGAEKLAFGLDQLLTALPASPSPPESNPEGLAHSVQAVVESVAPVPNSGNGLAPNILPSALWLGAGIAAFLMHVRVLPEQARSYARLARVGGKLLMPSLIVLLQSAALIAVSVSLLELRIVNLPAFAVILACSALTFLYVLYALNLVLGDAGKALGMLLLAVQMSASGGMLPIELSGHWFGLISPWLPLTWVVHALKAAMFGAFNGEWLSVVWQLGACAGGAVFLACMSKRWRYVSAQEIAPPVDL